jgi:hypothetical protein
MQPLSMQLQELLSNPAVQGGIVTLLTEAAKRIQSFPLDATDKNKVKLFTFALSFVLAGGGLLLAGVYPWKDIQVFATDTLQNGSLAFMVSYMLYNSVPFIKSPELYKK